VGRRRKLISIYSRIVRTYISRAPSLLLLAVVVFVPLGLLDALTAEATLDSADLSDGFKIAAVLAAVSAATVTGLLGEVFYSGAVAISLSHPENEQAPPLLEIARRLNYWRLIAVDLVYVLLVIVGMLAAIVPGILVFVWFGLAGPVVELEGRTVRGALGRSWTLVRHNFWIVFLVLGPIELIGDGLGDALSGLVHDLLGHTLVASWLAESVANIFLTPVFAIAAVLLTLDLIAEKDGTDLRAGPVAAPTPSPA
jgi:hypothetical protein